MAFWEVLGSSKMTNGNDELQDELFRFNQRRSHIRSHQYALFRPATVRLTSRTCEIRVHWNLNI